jgi:hypothetical protein
MCSSIGRKCAADAADIQGEPEAANQADRQNSSAVTDDGIAIQL